jgi:hypothetical protein
MRTQMLELRCDLAVQQVQIGDDSPRELGATLDVQRVLGALLHVARGDTRIGGAHAT